MSAKSSRTLVTSPACCLHRQLVVVLKALALWRLRSRGGDRRVGPGRRPPRRGASCVWRAGRPRALGPSEAAAGRASPKPLGIIGPSATEVAPTAPTARGGFHGNISSRAGSSTSFVCCACADRCGMAFTEAQERAFARRASGSRAGFWAFLIKVIFSTDQSQTPPSPPPVPSGRVEAYLFPVHAS